MRSMLRTSVGLLLWFTISITGAAPNVAFFYGANPPWEELQPFEIVVVEPLHGIEPRHAVGKRTEVFAYVSVGEVERNRPYAKDLPEGVVRGDNEPWASHVVDQTHPEWPRFFIERVVTPLWNAGYRGFFLDTLDSFQLISTTDEERTRQAQALAEVIRAMRTAFPQAKLIFNRGFEVLPELHREAYAVAVESIYRGWDQKTREYREVPEADRTWLLQQLERVRSEYRLPVIAIEYAPPAQRDLARTTAQRIVQLGFVPWVTNAELDLLGVGAIEVMPRKVLMLYDGAARDAKLYAHRIQVHAVKPLLDLGYLVEHLDVSKGLPAYPLVGRYAGIVSWFADDQAVRNPGVREWLARQHEHGMRMAVLGNFPFPLNDALAGTFGLSAGLPRAPRELRIELRDPVIGFEAQPTPEPRLFTPLRAVQPSAMLLRLRSDNGETMDAAAIMPWGGYVLTPYESVTAAGGDRWLIEPVEFMRRALALPPLVKTPGDTQYRPVTGGSNGIEMDGGTHVLAGLNTRGGKRYGLKQNASERSSTHHAS